MGSEVTDEERRRTSGISEMDAITGRMVLGLGSLKPKEIAMAAAEQMCS